MRLFLLACSLVLADEILWRTVWARTAVVEPIEDPHAVTVITEPSARTSAALREAGTLLSPPKQSEESRESLSSPQQLEERLDGALAAGKYSELRQLAARPELENLAFAKTLFGWTAQNLVAPMVDGVRRGRVEDAIQQERLIEELVGTQVRSWKHWISLPGLDLTDLAILAEDFCDDGPNDAFECRAGILLALERGLSEPKIPEGFLLRAGVFPWNEYRKLPCDFQLPQLERYLYAWQVRYSRTPHRLPSMPKNLPLATIPHFLWLYGNDYLAAGKASGNPHDFVMARNYFEQLRGMPSVYGGKLLEWRWRQACNGPR